MQSRTVLRKKSMSKLAYIANPENIDKAVSVDTTNGTYVFIRKKGEKVYFAYRRVDSGAGKHYFVQVNLSKEMFKELIASGRVPRLMNS